MSHLLLHDNHALAATLGSRYEMGMSIEAWARAYIESESLSEKLTPTPRPIGTSEATSTAVRIAKPGRPKELRQSARAKKAHTKGALVNAVRRADLMHRFLHHELQAAELMLWAYLAYSDAERPFRQGLLKIFDDEVRHMQSYAEYIEALGYHVGDFPVRDWIWDRVSSTTSALGFVSTMGIGFEGGNLDHTARFIEQFDAVGDAKGAELLRVVHEEEIPHVRFALHWYRRFRGEPVEPVFDDFDGWRAFLPAPLSPAVMKGPELDDASRTRAGFGREFLARLDRWTLADR